MTTDTFFANKLTELIDYYEEVSGVDDINDAVYQMLADNLANQISWYLPKGVYFSRETESLEDADGNPVPFKHEKLIEIIEDAEYDLEVYVDENYEIYAA